MPSPSPLVTSVFTLVPDGPGSSPGKLRVSVAVSPRRAGDGEKLSLIDWPAEVARTCKRLRLLIGDVQSRGGSTTIVNSAVLASTEAGASATMAFVPAAALDDPSESAGSPGLKTKLWRRIFGNADAAAQLENLLKALESGGQDASATATEIGGFRTAVLADAVNALSSSAVAATLAHRLEPGSRMPGSSATAFDAGRPGRGWWLQQYGAWMGRPPGSRLAALADRHDLPATVFPRLDPALAHAVASDQRAHGEHLQSLRAGEVFAEPLSARAGAGHAVDFLDHRILEPGYWTLGEFGGGSALAEDQAQFGVLAAEMHRLDLALNLPSNGGVGGDITPKPTPDPADPVQIAAHKFSSIQHKPTLAKFLNLIIDLEIDEAALRAAMAGRTGPVAIALDGQAKDAPFPLGEQAAWTCVRWTPATASAPARFGPAPRGGDAFTKEGLVSLKAKLPNGAPRFSLHRDDTARTCKSLTLLAETEADRYYKGAAAGDAPPLPSATTHGVILVDSGRDQAHSDDVVRATALKDQHAANKGNASQDQTVAVFFLEDLIRGFRLDANLLPSSSALQAERWRSLVGRSVNYSQDGLEAFQAGLPAAFARREDGFVQKSILSNSDGCVLPDQLASWTGDSLALPARVEVSDPDAGLSTMTDAQGHVLAGDWFAVDPSDAPVQYAVTAAADLTPPLRVGRRYLLGARPVFINGCGLTLDQARTAYSADNSLGDTDGSPFTYLRYAAIGAPQVLLTWTDPNMVVGKRKRGDSLDQLVVRGSGEVAWRALVPGSMTFSEMEQQGLFDGDTRARPGGALEVSAPKGDQVRVWLHRTNGHFPVATEQGIRFPEQPVEGSPAEENRGLVLVLDDKDYGTPPAASKDPTTSLASRTALPFYPDPLGRVLRAQLIDPISKVVIATLSAPLEFWPASSPVPGETAPMTATLIYIRLNGQAGSSTSRGSLASGTTQVTPRNSARPVTLKTLVVNLPEGVSADLKLWCDTDIEQLITQHGVIPAAFGRLAKLGKGYDFSTSAKRTAAWASVQAQGPVSQVQDSTTVHVVHATPTPGTPSLLNGDRTVSLNAVVLTVLPEGVASPPGKMLSTWRDYVAAQGKGGCSGHTPNCLTWKSQEGGSTTFFVGTAAIDRLVTGKMRCVATWEENGPSHYVLTKGSKTSLGCYSYKAKTTSAQLFTIDAEPADSRLASKRLDLLSHDLNPDSPVSLPALRALSYNFPDGKARQLRVKLIAASRFTNFFDEPNACAPGSPTPCADEASSAEQVIWTPCTFRPPPPDIERVVPIFKWTRKLAPGGSSVELVRQVRFRVHLQRTWFASGEGEQLAILFPQLRSTTPPVCAFDDALLAPFQGYLSRWGVDPAHTAAPSNGVLAMAAITNATWNSKGWVKANGRPLELHLSDSGAGGGVHKIAVDACAFNVEASDCEGHYVDIAIDLPNTYFPFVQLGLARLQTHSVETLELSQPTAIFVQPPPSRRITATLNDDDDRVTIVVHGVGFHDANAQCAPTPRGMPLLRVTLMTHVEGDAVEEDHGTGGIQWIPVGDDVQPLEDLCPNGKRKDELWNVPFELPETYDKQPWALKIEEYEVLTSREGHRVERVFLSRVLKVWSREQDDYDETHW